MIDPRFVSAGALIVIGAILCGFIIRVWNTHPINRVFVLGPYVTQAGQALLLKNLPTVFAIGLGVIAAGGAKIGYALRWHGQAGGDWADHLGIIEMVFLLWAAGCVIVAAWRLWRKG